MIDVRDKVWEREWEMGSDFISYISFYVLCAKENIKYVTEMISECIFQSWFYE